MPRKEEPTTTCNFCKRGRVIKRTEEIAFRQPSDIGYIRCRVTVSIGFCDVCEATSVDPGVDKILEQASARILSCFAAPAPLPPACRGDSIGGGLLLVTMACRCATAPAWFILLLPTCLDATEQMKIGLQSFRKFVPADLSLSPPKKATRCVSSIERTPL
jgi:hypothetical protein